MTDLDAHLLKNLMPQFVENVKQEARRTEYGPWKINREGGFTTLDYVGEPYQNHPYWIREDRMDTPGKILNWVAHLSEKNWATPEVLGWFLFAAMKLTPKAFRETEA